MPDASTLWNAITTGKYEPPAPKKKAKPKANGAFLPPVEVPIEVTTAIILLIEATRCTRCNEVTQLPSRLMIRQRHINKPNRTEHYKAVELDEALAARQRTIHIYGQYPRWQQKTVTREVPVCQECFSDIALEPIEEERK